MRKMFLTILLGAIASPALAQDLLCDGTESGGSGANSCGPALRYAYPATDPGGDRVAIEIGTDDPIVGNYTNVCMPAGWAFAIAPNTGGDPIEHYPSKTAHGVVSPGPNGTCTHKIVFSGPPGLPGGAFTFGFDHFMKSHDVGWTSSNGTFGIKENWANPVGNGTAPVHAPKSTEGIPTLSEWGVVVMILLLLGAGTVVFGRMRKRQTA